MASSSTTPSTLQPPHQHQNGLHHGRRNDDDGENVPIAGGNRMKMMRRFGTMLMGGGGSDNNANSDGGNGTGDGAGSADAPLGGASRLNAPSGTGYVEFGMSDPERSTRTLGTFAGVFSPVALSMFSALLFIRVGKCCRANKELIYLFKCFIL